MLLRQLGLVVGVTAPNVDEGQVPGEDASDLVARLALAKWQEVLAGADVYCPVLAADTVVVKSGKLMGKPATRSEGIEMLRTLSGTAHEVITGVCVGLPGAAPENFVVSTTVEFRHIDEHEMGCYWASGEPLDKAGGYAIQGLGAVFVERIEGSYSNVVGLPLTETAAALARCEVDCLALAGERSRAG